MTRKSQKPPRGTWCTFSGEIICKSSEEAKKQHKKFIRCPACNRRIKPGILNCEFPHSKCFHLKLPRHKLRKTKTV